jgi:putative ABC transport system permease protein
LIASQLHNIVFYDPFTLAVATLLLIATAVVACYIPAKRAVHEDALAAIRYD